MSLRARGGTRDRSSGPSSVGASVLEVFERVWSNRVAAIGGGGVVVEMDRSCCREGLASMGVRVYDGRSEKTT